MRKKKEDDDEIGIFKYNSDLFLDYRVLSGTKKIVYPVAVSIREGGRALFPFGVDQP